MDKVATCSKPRSISIKISSFLLAQATGHQNRSFSCFGEEQKQANKGNLQLTSVAHERLCLSSIFSVVSTLRSRRKRGRGMEARAWEKYGGLGTGDKGTAFPRPYPSVPHFFPAFSLRFPFPVYACYAGYLACVKNSNALVVLFDIETLYMCLMCLSKRMSLSSQRKSGISA